MKTDFDNHSCSTNNPAHKYPAWISCLFSREVQVAVNSLCTSVQTYQLLLPTSVLQITSKESLTSAIQPFTMQTCTWFNNIMAEG